MDLEVTLVESSDDGGSEGSGLDEKLGHRERFEGITAAITGVEFVGVV